MYRSTRGIVFHQTRFSDTSLILRIFTEDLGLRSYIVKGALRPGSRMKASLFQPLTLLEMVVSDRDKGQLHHIREARIAFPFHNIANDIQKSSVLIFLNELLYKSIREESANRELFGFISENLKRLDQTEKNIAQFPLLFTVQLTRFLGFLPQERYLDASTVFDLQEGVFTNMLPLGHELLMRGPICKYFSQLVNMPMERWHELRAEASLRRELLEKLLLYYTIHLPIQGDFRSHKVLHELFR